jgi:hypothetical protein
MWAYTDPDNVSRQAREVCSAQEWGEFTRYLDALPDPRAELTRLCAFGWAHIEELVAELIAALAAARPKAAVRKVAANVQRAIGLHANARHIGLGDGTGPQCPACGSHQR